MPTADDPNGTVAALERIGVTPAAGTRQQALGVARRASAFLRAAIEGSPAGLCFVDGAGRCLLANGSLGAMLGFDASALVGADVLALVHPDDRQEVGAELQAAWTATDPPLPGEVRLTRADGADLPVRLTVTPVVGDDGVLCTAVAVEDRTEHRALEAAGQLERDRFEAIVERSPERTMVVAPDWTLLYVSPATQALIALEAGQTLPLDRLHPQDRPTARRAFEAAVSDPKQPTFVAARIRAADGSWRRIETTMTNMVDNPAVGGVVFNTRDVTDQHRARARFEAIVERSSELYAVVGPSGRVRYLSPETARVTGATVGDPFTEMAAEGRDRAVLDSAFRTTGAGMLGDHTTVRWQRRGPDGEVRLMASTVTNLLEDSAVAGWVVNSRDVTEEARLTEALTHQAYHDTLTGLANRALLLQQLAADLKGGPPVTVAVLDLDRFRLLNETSGHAAGDDLLCQVASRLVAAATATGTVARLGGDEFVIVAPHCDRDGATALVRRLAHALGEPMRLATGNHHVITASIGISISTSAEDTPEVMLRRAEAALYQAKARGRNCAEIFDDEHLAQVQQRHSTEQRLRSGLAGTGFGLGYQPIVDLATGRPVAAEALLRMNLPPPPTLVSDLVAVAEDSGLIFDLGERVLGEACRRAAAWPREVGSAAPLGVAVNVSARQLGSADFVAGVRRHLEATGLAPTTLCLEFTETTLLEANRQTTDTLQALRATGVRLAIDDFGTGYSSLTYLRRFPLDYLKIDRSFVHGLGTEPRDTAIVRAVIWLARAVGLQVVAEGVETEAQCTALRELECDMAQGYYFSEALAEGAFEDLLRRHPTW